MNPFSINTPYGDFNCTVRLERYANNGRQAMRLMDAKDNSPLAMVSVNFSDADIPEGYIAVKTWHEGFGILEELIKSGILAEPMSYHEFGAISSPICKILI